MAVVIATMKLLTKNVSLLKHKRVLRRTEKEVQFSYSDEASVLRKLL